MKKGFHVWWLLVSLKNNGLLCVTNVDPHIEKLLSLSKNSSTIVISLLDTYYLPNERQYNKYVTYCDAPLYLIATPHPKLRKNELILNSEFFGDNLHT